MIKKVIVLGNHIQSLGLIRIASKVDLSATLFNDRYLCLSVFSKYCKKFVIFQGLDDLKLKLLGIYSGKKDTMLVPTNDRMVQFLEKNYHALSQHFFILMPHPPIANICLDKRLTYGKAQELGIPVPTFFCGPDLDRARELANKAGYPLVLRPAFAHTFSKAAGRKMFLCENEKSLLKNYKLASRFIPEDEIIIQKYIVGGFKQLYSFCSFFADGNVYSCLTAHRLRQRPRIFGSGTTFAKTVKNEDIEQLSERFLRGVNFLGISEIEFMYDSFDGEYKLLEINPRPWKWHSIVNKLGINFLKIAADYFAGRKIEAELNEKFNVGWIDPLPDFYMFISGLLRRSIKVNEYIDSLKINKESAVFSKDDALPGIAYCLLLPYFFFSRR